MSKLPAVVDGLVTVITTALATAGTDEHSQPAPIVVYDGPRASSAFPRECVLVGDDGEDTDNVESGRSDRGWAGLGAKKRDENGEIQCAIVCWSGDVELKPLRDRAFVLLDLIEDALTTDPSLAGATGQPGWAYVTAAPLHQKLVAAGAVARIPFVVTFRARIV